MKKILIVTLGLLCIILGLGAFLIRENEDNNPPEIIFSEDTIECKEGDESNLLTGVQAIDKEDGDVSNSIRVGEIYPNKRKNEAKVVYYAKDKSNNLVSETRTVKYIAKDGEEESVEEKAKEMPIKTVTPIPEATVTTIPTDEPETTVTTVPTDEPETTQAPLEEEQTPVDPSAPVITLTKEEDTIARGEEVNRLTYVQEIADDKDTRESLYRGIQIKGQIDTTKAGDNELIYYVVDSDGNKSNEAKLVITVR